MQTLWLEICRVFHQHHLSQKSITEYNTSPYFLHMTQTWDQLSACNVPLSSKGFFSTGILWCSQPTEWVVPYLYWVMGLNEHLNCLPPATNQTSTCHIKHLVDACWGQSVFSTSPSLWLKETWPEDGDKTTVPEFLSSDLRCLCEDWRCGAQETRI